MDVDRIKRYPPKPYYHMQQDVTVCMQIFFFMDLQKSSGSIPGTKKRMDISECPLILLNAIFYQKIG